MNILGIPLFGANGLLRITGNLYLTDLFDILIIALFLYSIFILFKRTRTYLIFIGSIFIIALYLLAKSFNLYLTSLFLQYFVGVSILIFVIIFQTEIRKYFEMLGLMGTRQIKVGRLSAKSPSTSEILQACVKMAQSKIGALIVIRGQDNLDPLIEGGVTTDAVISEELMLSIFDPHSEGHDGAIIIENNRLAKLGVHLPLSNNFKELKKVGTRHGAALGLSEQSDALCIVVSEERGKISICKEGKLKTLENYSDLEKELDRYIKTRFDQNRQNFFKSLFTHNVWLKLSAGLTAAVLWFFTAYQAGIIQKEYSIPVTFTDSPREVFIENYSPKEVYLTVSGRGDAAFSGISALSFKININASDLSDGVNQIEIPRKNITVPLNLSLVSYSPENILLTARKYISLQVPISVKTTGDPASGFSVKDIKVTPAFLDLWIPASATPPSEIRTQSIDISGMKESTVIPVNLVLPDNVRLQKGEGVANVALTVGE